MRNFIKEKLPNSASLGLNVNFERAARDLAQTALATAKFAVEIHIITETSVGPFALHHFNNDTQCTIPWPPLDLILEN